MVIISTLYIAVSIYMYKEKTSVLRIVCKYIYFTFEFFFPLAIGTIIKFSLVDIYIIILNR